MTEMAASVRTITNGLNSGSGSYLCVIRHPHKVSASLLQFSGNFILVVIYEL